MWIIIILSILAIIVARFFYALNKNNKKISSQGGMRTKYNCLINHILNGDTRARIIQDTSNAVLIGLSNFGGSTYFDINEAFSSVTIRWKIDSPVFGKHNQEWEFPENFDQNEIYNTIESDILVYTRKIMGI